MGTAAEFHNDLGSLVDQLGYGLVLTWSLLDHLGDRDTDQRAILAQLNLQLSDAIALLTKAPPDVKSLPAFQRATPSSGRGRHNRARAIRERSKTSVSPSRRRGRKRKATEER